MSQVCLPNRHGPKTPESASHAPDSLCFARLMEKNPRPIFRRNAGTFSEVIVPRGLKKAYRQSGAALGNFPKTFTHLALISLAFKLYRYGSKSYRCTLKN